MLHDSALYEFTTDIDKSDWFASWRVGESSRTVAQTYTVRTKYTHFLHLTSELFRPVRKKIGELNNKERPPRSQMHQSENPF